MTLYTVEVTTDAVAAGEFGSLHRFLDIVPGTVLLEDAAAPTLMFPVDADSPMQAARFVDGLAKLGDLELVSGRVYETSSDFDIDFDDDDEVAETTTPAAQAVRDWMRDDTKPSGKLDECGRLADA